MEKKIKKRKIFGLVGKNISYSFSKKYFTDKFEKAVLKNTVYENFDLESIEKFTAIFTDQPEVKGLNVTIPYKEAVIPYLNKLSKNAKKIGAVNTITISKKGKTKGYNTDYYGFKKSLKPLLQPFHKKALILGTGGASKGIAFALKKLNIEFDFVSRTPTECEIGYAEIDAETFKEYQIFINCTPLGTHPNVHECPELPYEYFTPGHIAYDLIYNPKETVFLSEAKAKGAVTKNGYDMLVYQAEKSWDIWHK